jgi:hypothetical protein
MKRVPAAARIALSYVRVRKVRDIAGLYFTPPERPAVVYPRKEPDPSARQHTTAFAHASGASGGARYNIAAAGLTWRDACC